MSGAASHDGGWGAHHRASPPVQHDNGELYAWGGGGVPNAGAPRMGAWAAGAASPSASGSALSGGRHDDDDDDEHSNSPHRMGPGGDGGAGRYGPPGGEVSRSARRRRQRARKAEARTQELKQLFVDGEGLSHGTAPYNALLSALANGWYDVARDLIRMSLPLGGLKGDGLAPAVAALSSGNASVVEVLFEHGVSPLVRDASGSTLLHIAVKQVARLCVEACLLYTSPSPRDATLSRMPSSA